MNPRVRLLSALLERHLYVIEERRVAEAILIRAAARAAVPDVAFEKRARRLVRSFRPSREVRSFRLLRARRAHR
jgi:hypothetical protein